MPCLLSGATAQDGAKPETAKPDIGVGVFHGFASHSKAAYLLFLFFLSTEYLALRYHLAKTVTPGGVEGWVQGPKA